jgi:hypothetical protein
MALTCGDAHPVNSQQVSPQLRAAGRALTAARAEAAILAGATRTIIEDEAPFRRPE